MMMEKAMSRSIRLMFAGSMVLGMQTALAQQTGEVIQKVEVTGSRIPSINVDGASPVTMISERDIKIDGAKNVEDLLNNLPQVFADQGANISNGATGTATVSLRGLGCDRTLVLINGKRMPMGSALTSCADLNQIPAGLIKRVDILTGGAAAVYGAGAVAGVVNFILKDNFEGVQFEANLSGYNHHQQNPSGAVEALNARKFPVPGNIGFDGQSKEASILMGSNFADNKGNATLFFSYKQDSPILQATRDFSACSFGSNAAGFNCSGSSTSANGRFIGPNGSFTNSDTNGTAIKYSGARDAFNFAPYNFYQRQGETYSMNANAHFDINDKVRLYEEFSFHTYTTDAQIAPSGIFLGDPNHLVISASNPLLSQSWKNALGLVNPTDTVDLSGNIGRRNVEGGNRYQRITDTSFREVLGAKGDVGNWSYDVFAQFARVNHSDTQNNYFSVAKINRALDVVVGPNGTPVCRSVVDGSDPSCVPYNIWRKGGVTPEALKYLYTPGLAGGYTQQSVYGGSLATDLGTYGVKSPLAKDGVGIAFGVERRTEKLVFDPDNEVATGDLAGTGGTGVKPVSGDYSVKEVYGEVKVPLIQDRPMIKSLDLDGTYRHSDYSFDKKTDTYGVGVDWTINQIARLRGSYQRAVRAPTIFDLYTPQSIGLGGLVGDPCAGTPTLSQAGCARTGVTAAQYGNLPDNPAGQYNSLLGGNSNTSPEKADTFTLGAVLSPVKDLTVSVDYFKIKVKDYIQAGIDPNTALSQCAATGDPVFCGAVHRDANGSLWLSPNGYMKQINTNIGSLSTSGLDLSAAYNMKAGTMGSLNFVLNGTYLKTLKTQSAPGANGGDDTYDCSGYYGKSCGTPNPTWRHKFRTMWATPWKLQVAGTWRHIASVKNDAQNPSALLAGSVNPIEAELGARDYFDVYASYPLAKGVTLSGGINNLFDKDPPLGSSNVLPGVTGSGNTFPQVYDTLGRKIYLNVSVMF